MTRPKVSIVMATHNRAHLFARSLKCYARQAFKDFEILLLDDDSTDDMRAVCQEHAPKWGLDLKHIWFKKPPGVGFRDGACQINYGIRAAAGDLIVVTSPEVMPGLTSVSELVAHFERAGFDAPHWTSCKCYMLSARHQELIDTVDWEGQGPSAAVRTLPGFYKEPSAEYTGAALFEADAIDKQVVFGASLFCAMTRKGWRNIGGFPESEVWGSPDPSFLAERWRLGTPCYTCQLPDSTCVHQNHDMPGDIATPRDMAKCVANQITGPWDNIRW
jgi:GT2 family glycosyltransferase